MGFPFTVATVWCAALPGADPPGGGIGVAAAVSWDGTGRVGAAASAVAAAAGGVDAVPVCPSSLWEPPQAANAKSATYVAFMAGRNID
jgi:hypothetical protein